MEHRSYLWSTIAAQNNREKDLNARILAGNRNCYALQPLISNKHAAREMKDIIYKTILKPGFMYGLETWTMSSNQQKRIQRKICGESMDQLRRRYL